MPLASFLIKKTEANRISNIDNGSADINNDNSEVIGNKLWEGINW